jgi:1-aminocyclopropane-1-carboxylate deaminase
MPNWISYTEPPIRGLNIPELAACQVNILVRREDMNHPFVSGNKWWKLKYNLLEAAQHNYDTVLTFGGAYSNHVYATAAACSELKMKSIGVIRGEEVRPLNSTLAFAESCGMKLHFVSREDYRKKNDPTFLSLLQEKFGRCFAIPEGGTNELAVRGAEELGKELNKIEFDYLCLPVGTGGTIAGIIKALDGNRKIIGIPVLKDGGFLKVEIQKFLPHEINNWDLMLDYHHGGYAKTSPQLEAFTQNLKQHDLETEHVYSGKLFWGVFDLIRNGFFKKGATVLAPHTGGLR